MTEETLVAAIREITASTANAKLRLGIGDDAAAWQPSRSHLSVITTDALIEDVHFTRAAMSAADVGHRSLAANLSDIAAMGARPVLATVAFGVSSAIDEEWVRDFYRGLTGLATRTGTAIAGGDIVRAPVVSISITVVGEVRRSSMKTRSGARAGDVIAVTGPLGASRAGCEIALDRPRATQPLPRRCAPTGRPSRDCARGGFSELRATSTR
jgi:thiamine-monophosphate kinase